MTTVNQDYPGHSRARPSNSPHLAAIQDPHQQHAHSQAAVTDAWTEAFARLQQQVQYNTTALEDQRRYLAEFNDVVRTLHAEIGSLWRKVDALKDQREARPRPVGAVKPDDADIDLLTSELQHVANKANEIEGVKLQLEIMTRRLRRLEGHPSPAAVTTAAPVESSSYQTHPHHAPAQQPPQQHRPPVAAKSEPRPLDRHPAHAQSAAEARPVEQPHGAASRAPAFRPVDGPNGAATWRTSSQAAPQPETASVGRADGHAASGWNAVNNAPHSKRTASMDGSGHNDGSAPGSPKRQKLATLAPRGPFDSATNGHGAPHQHAYDHTQAPRSVSGESHPSGPGAPIRFVPFPGRDTNGHEARRTESVDGRARNRKSGGEEDVKPDHEWREWSATNGDAYARHPQHSYHLSAPPTDHYRQPHSYSPDGHLGDTPSPALNESNKKSRTKPTRNADGILIRKDGRPDMRSISSAMNLRKVHAKKEAERTSGPGEDDTPATTEGDETASVGRSMTPPEQPATGDVAMADAAPAVAAAQATM